MAFGRYALPLTLASALLAKADTQGFGGSAYLGTFVVDSPCFIILYTDKETTQFGYVLHSPIKTLMLIDDTFLPGPWSSSIPSSPYLENVTYSLTVPSTLTDYDTTDTSLWVAICKIKP